MGEHAVGGMSAEQETKRQLGRSLALPFIA